MVPIVSPEASAADWETWTVVVSEFMQDEEVVRIALEDLETTGTEHALRFKRATDASKPAGNILVLGAPQRNRLTDELVSDGVFDLPESIDEQGYAIRSAHHDGRRVVVVAGGSLIGDVYGLYWVWDRIRVHKYLPDINVDRAPAMKVRVGAAWGKAGHGGSSKEQMRAALRHSTNWVAGPAVLDLVPWNSEPEASTNAKNRETARELIDYAHSLHMKYLSFANEFSYHPSLLEEFGATLSPDDPKFWDALQGKYRKLFEALPELDGIELCNDDLSGFWDSYKVYDILHENPESEWSYEKRFRTFVKKIHEVVAGEFGKTYIHFTWGLSAHEQHVQPAVFREIFTPEIPTNNLYLMPKITAADRWWHQPYNSTFNLTPHDTLVCFETMNYYETRSTNIFPTFSGQYFQSGLQYLLMPENTNLRGAATLAGLRQDTWDTTSAYVYVLYRLMWDPYEDIETIAHDFCSIHFGPEAAEAMARIYLLSPSAYKYGLHIEPVSYGQYNSFIHMRVGMFPAEGYPSIDHGREHIEFLRGIYLRCKPWERETLDDLEHGLDVAGQMIDEFKSAKRLLHDPATATDIQNRLDMTQHLIATNIGYVRTMFAYFDYYDRPDATARTRLVEEYDALARARADFVAAPGFGYDLYGVDELMKSAKAAIDDLDAARSALETAPTREQLERTVGEQQRRYAEVLGERAQDAVHFAHLEVMVDGRDILSIKGDKYEIEHLRWDNPHIKELRFLEPMPNRAVTVIPKDIYSRPLHPFVLEQPNETNDYTVRIYLDDLPGGNDWIVCDLYYIPEPPDAVGLALPWK